MNDKNLLQNDMSRSLAEKKELCRKGQRKGIETKKRKRQLKEELLILLDNNNNKEKICIALIDKALKGNVKAFEVIRDTIGENSKNIQSNVNLNRVIIINDLPDEECIDDYLENKEEYIEINIDENNN